MVSKASDDLPEPDSPVKTISRSRGSSRLTLRRLCSRAPRMTSESAIGGAAYPAEKSFRGGLVGAAIARDPMHLHDVADHLDRPRYRLQRPLYPLLAWLLHPGGGGMGLVLAMFG